MRIRLAAVLALIFAIGSGWAQSVGTPVSVAPNCTVFLDLLASGASTPFDNRFIGCDLWKVNYTSTGFTGVSVELQYAADNGGEPGTWTSWSGGVISGSNPATATDHAQILARGYYPWVRVSAALTGSGRLRGGLYGYRTQATTAASQPYCDLSSAVAVTGSGSLQLVGATAGKAIHVCGFSLSAQTAPVDLKLVQGAGSNCGTGTADVTGYYYGVDAVALAFPEGPLRLTAGNALCVQVSSATSLGGVVVYALK